MEEISEENTKIQDSEHKDPDQCEETEKQLCIYYDERAKLHPDNHEEIQLRSQFIWDALAENKLLKSDRVHLSCFNQIEVEDLTQVHTTSLVQKILSAGELKDGETSKMFGEENTENKHTPECARLAAGSSLQAMKDVVTSPFTPKAAFSLMRPPGHHATEGHADGYCFFNNAAIAAHFAIKSYNLKRVLILDWDVHHGDGTQEIFYESSKVFFMSVHRWENGKYFPYKDCSNYTYLGSKQGEGFNLNVPWNTTEEEDDLSEIGTKEYQFLFENLLFGIMAEFDPELIIVSAGFDSAKGDPLGLQQVDHEFYSWLCVNLQKICPKIVMVIRRRLLNGYFS
ncbi:unnamed protein product [Moneuplotes crassus]|uniref:histone deacetylase n=1 Tax=Euplotes crassus TaxID=5936 RepID=A0AAD1UI82_EUPCR|nr:unnamed protein product [Moneuplotes crassus]